MTRDVLLFAISIAWGVALSVAILRKAPDGPPASRVGALMAVCGDRPHGAAFLDLDQASGLTTAFVVIVGEVPIRPD
jgi:hypothetical protein